jgi:hypothetical protein
MTQTRMLKTTVILTVVNTGLIVGIYLFYAVMIWLEYKMD